MCIGTTKKGISIQIAVQPRAKRAGIVGLHGDRLKIALRSPPVDGRANLELIEIISEALGCSKNSISLMRGATGRNKIIEVIGISIEQCQKKLMGNLA